MFGVIEHTFMCPYCGSHIHMQLEQFIKGQEYIEDCEVCCNPIKISYKAGKGELTEFRAQSIEQ